jgi:hypothetical protein
MTVIHPARLTGGAGRHDRSGANHGAEGSHRLAMEGRERG